MPNKAVGRLFRNEITRGKFIVLLIILVLIIKYPDFLSTTGNLAIKPADDSDLDSLLIWPNAGSGFEYGVILNDNGSTYQVYINPDGKTALYEDDQWLVDDHAAIIRQYLRKANAMWDLSQ